MLKIFLREQIQGVLERIWTEIRSLRKTNHGGGGFAIKNEKIHCFVRRQLGFNARSVVTWDLKTLPLIKIGKTMATIKTLPDMHKEAQIQAVVEIKNTLQGLLPPKLLEG
jgi:hypothetical protein